MRTFSAGLFAIALLASAPPCRGQGTRHTGFSVERLYLDHNPLPAVSVRHSDLGARGLGADVAVGLLPTILPSELVLPFEAGLAQGARVGPATLILKAGMAGLLLGRQRTIYPGAQVGAAFLMRVEQRLEVRADLTRRRYWLRDSGAVDSWSIGIGFAVRATKTRPARPSPSP